MSNPNPRTDHIEPYRFNSGNAAANGRKGAYAANEARRKRRACADIAMRVISSELSGADRAKVEKITGPLGDDEATLYAAALAQVVTKAVKGDLRAFRELQNVVEKAQGPATLEQREDDPLSAALKELGKSL